MLKTKKQYNSLGKCLGAAIMALSLCLGGCKSEPTKEEEVSQAQAEIDSVASQVVSDATADSTDPAVSRKIDFAELESINPEVIGWIYIPDTGVDYPVMQSADDEKYLTTTIGNETNITGSIYAESWNSANFSDPVTILYGHTVFDDPNKQYDQMFTDLHKYEDIAFMESDPYIYIYTPEQTIKYQVFSCVNFDDRYLPASYDFSVPESFQNYIDDLRNTPGAIVNPEVTVNADSKILTLSTCVGLNSDRRLLVSGVEIASEPNV